MFALGKLKETRALSSCRIAITMIANYSGAALFQQLGQSLRLGGATGTVRWPEAGRVSLVYRGSVREVLNSTRSYYEDARQVRVHLVGWL